MFNKVRSQAKSLVYKRFCVVKENVPVNIAFDVRCVTVAALYTVRGSFVLLVYTGHVCDEGDVCTRSSLSDICAAPLSCVLVHTKTLLSILKNKKV